MKRIFKRQTIDEKDFFSAKPSLARCDKNDYLLVEERMFLFYCFAFSIATKRLAKSEKKDYKLLFDEISEQAAYEVKNFSDLEVDEYMDSMIHADKNDKDIVTH